MPQTSSPTPLSENALRESEERFRLFVAASSDTLYTMSADWSEMRSLEGMTFLGISEYPSRTWLQHYIPQEDHPYVLAAIQQAIQTKSIFALEHRVIGQDGTVGWMFSRAIPLLDAHNEIREWFGAASDITARKQAEEALRASEERYRLAMENIHDYAIFTLDKEGRVTSWSEGARRVKGYNADAVLGQHFRMFSTPEDQLAGNPEYELADVTSTGRHESESWRVRNGGALFWGHKIITAIHDETGILLGFVNITRDLTERKLREGEREEASREAERKKVLERTLYEAQAQADRDPLTSLLNHRAFQKRLEEEAGRAHREKTTLAVVMMDLDNFKFFNDAYGHAVGDQVLRLVAQRLEQVCRPYDTVARFGGDEFALLLPGVGHTLAAEVEARLRTDLGCLAYRISTDGMAIPITVSVGAALFPDGSQDWHAVLRQADERLLRSKTGAEGETETDRFRATLGRSVEGFSLLDALVTAVDNKDRYTRKHSEGVVTYCLLIARELSMSEAEQRTIATAALLHDVGKIGVPDAILRKPRRLTDEELEAVKQHPQMGAILVSAIPGLEDTLDAVRHHHERWDGQGYPLGLKAEATPLLARIMAVADAFSAMTTDRPYRKGLAYEEAQAILRAGAGSQWDAECVAAFLRTQGEEARVI